VGFLLVPIELFKGVPLSTGQKKNVQLETDVRRLAEFLEINPDQPNSKLANALDAFIQEEMSVLKNKSR
jgi:hypothetical protein